MQAYVRITDDLEAEARRLKPAIVRSVQLGSGPLLDAAGFDVRVPDHDVLLPDGTDLGHPKDIEMAISVASQWISDEVAIWFAQHVFFFGTAAQVADRLTALAHARGAGGRLHPRRLLQLPRRVDPPPRPRDPPALGRGRLGQEQARATNAALDRRGVGRRHRRRRRRGHEPREP